MEKIKLHYIVSTHWDREWYSSFQDFRYRLVRLIDRIIIGIENSALKGPFTLDGQVIPIEDYLEIRPERREQVMEYIQAGKIVIGPWYVMPDEFTVPGESLIRNLRLGHDLAHQFGTEVSKGGFVCDIFGHNSQMPQIFKQFGIRGAFLWRGTNQIQKRNMIWQGADGTEIPVYRFENVGYCSFAIAVRSKFNTKDGFDRAAGEKALDEFIAFCRETGDIDTILLFDGCDHQEWDQQVYEVMIEKFGEESEFHFVHGTFDDYLDDLEAQLGKVTTRLTGELREPGFEAAEKDQQWLIPGVLSSRIWHKQANWDCENKLTHWAEPFSVLANNVLDREYPAGFLNVAWKWLIKNHPHDSIDGCSIDQVHRDMMFRYDQSRGIAERVKLEALQAITASVTGDISERELRVGVFNPQPQVFEGVTEMELTFPGDWATFNEFFGFEPKPAFRIYDAEGTELPYQRVGQRLENPLRAQHKLRQQSVTVAATLTVPAMGYTMLMVKEAPKAITRYDLSPGMASSDCSMENEIFHVVIENDGTLSMMDKRNGRTYFDLMQFEDCADIGDGWYHGVAANDEVLTGVGNKVEIARITDGFALTQFRVRRMFEVPAHFDYSDMRRSKERKTVVIESILSLRPGQDYLDIVHTIENTAEDHRMRVMYPSGALKAKSYWADSQFDAVTRPIALREDNHLYRELEVETKPQQSWTVVTSKRGGLAVISAGQLESAVLDLPDRPIAITLFRSTHRTVGTEGEPDGLMLGKIIVKQYLMPLNGKLNKCKLFTLAQQQTNGLTTVQMDSEKVRQLSYEREIDPSQPLPAEGSFFSLEGKAVLSSASMVGEYFEMRLFNPTSKKQDVKIKFGDGSSYQSGWPVNLLSEPIGDTQVVEGGSFEWALLPKQIVTLRFE